MQCAPSAVARQDTFTCVIILSGIVAQPRNGHVTWGCSELPLSANGRVVGEIYARHGKTVRRPLVSSRSADFRTSPSRGNAKGNSEVVQLGQGLWIYPRRQRRGRV